MIEVRLTFRDCMLNPVGYVDKKLEEAGVPPVAIRDGMVKHWWENDGDVMVYQYIPRADYEIVAAVTPGTSP